VAGKTLKSPTLSNFGESERRAGLQEKIFKKL